MACSQGRVIGEWTEGQRSSSVAGQPEQADLLHSSGRPCMESNSSHQVGQHPVWITSEGSGHAGPLSALAICVRQALPHRPGCAAEASQLPELRPRCWRPWLAAGTPWLLWPSLDAVVGARGVARAGAGHVDALASWAGAWSSCSAPATAVMSPSQSFA